MRIFITGANGFIGGAVASALIAEGHTVRGLVRDPAKADAVATHGIVPVIGSLGDAALLQAEAHAADDRRRREEAEVRNQADSLVYQTEKMLKDQASSFDGAQKSAVESDLTTLKDALAGSDVAYAALFDRYGVIRVETLD